MDDDNKLRGPYKKYVIKTWHMRKWLPFDVKIRRLDQRLFTTFNKIVSEIMNDDYNDKDDRYREKTEYKYEDPGLLLSFFLFFFYQCVRLFVLGTHVHVFFVHFFKECAKF